MLLVHECVYVYTCTCTCILYYTCTVRVHVHHHVTVLTAKWHDVHMHVVCTTWHLCRYIITHTCTCHTTRTHMFIQYIVHMWIDTESSVSIRNHIHTYTVRTYMHMYMYACTYVNTSYIPNCVYTHSSLETELNLHCHPFCTSFPAQRRSSQWGA